MGLTSPTRALLILRATAVRTPLPAGVAFPVPWMVLWGFQGEGARGDTLVNYHRSLATFRSRGEGHSRSSLRDLQGESRLRLGGEEPAVYFAWLESVSGELDL